MQERAYGGSGEEGGVPDEEPGTGDAADAAYLDPLAALLAPLVDGGQGQAAGSSAQPGGECGG